MKQEHGFTLIELLVTVSIVSLLAAIAIPQFNEYKKKAYIVELSSLTRSTVTAAYTQFFDTEEDIFVDQEGRAELNALPGMALLPEHVGGYANVRSNIFDGRRHTYVSIQLCHMKIEEAGRVGTYRYREIDIEEREFSQYNEFLPQGLWFTESDCEDHI